MKSTQVRNIKRRLIESYMNELRFNTVNFGYGISNTILFESPSNNSYLRSKMREIENLYAQESELKLKRTLK